MTQSTQRDPLTRPSVLELADQAFFRAGPLRQDEVVDDEKAEAHERQPMK